jgi:uncharacterized protein (TIGR02265 family)
MTSTRGPAGVVYAHTVQSFIRSLVVEPGLQEGLRPVAERLGVRLDKPGEMSGPAFNELIEAVALARSPGLPREVALFETGRAMVASYGEGVVGKTLLLVSRMVGPRGTLARLPESYASADSVTQVTVTERGPRHVELRFNAASKGVIDYDRGIVSATLEPMVSGLEVAAMPLVDGALLRVTWAGER